MNDWSCFAKNGCAPSVWGAHAWHSLHELARRGASVSMIREICGLLVCVSCRNSIAKFQVIVSMSEIESLELWVRLAHDHVNTMLAKPKFDHPTDCLDTEDFSFHLTLTLCFFADHHPREKLAPLFSMLSYWCKSRTPWLLSGLQDFSAESLLLGHNARFPGSGLPWSVVKWVIDSSRASVR